MQSELKALTHINLPFIEERFAPGESIPYDRFVASAERASGLITHPRNSESSVPTADEMIAELIANGSVSEDADAPLHPDHIIPDPNRITLSQIVADAQRLVDELEAAGESVPAKLRDIAGTSERLISATDQGLAADLAATEGAS